MSSAQGKEQMKGYKDQGSFPLSPIPPGGSLERFLVLKYSLAHAFCCFLTAVEDVNPAVATRAGLLLDTIKRPALQVMFLPCDGHCLLHI